MRIHTRARIKKNLDNTNISILRKCKHRRSFTPFISPIHICPARKNKKNIIVVPDSTEANNRRFNPSQYTFPIGG